MFRLINKSAIWHLCQCVNHWLWNSSKWPFTSAVLQTASRYNLPTRPPAIVGPRNPPRVCGRLVGRSVGESVVSNIPCYSGAQVHLGDAHSKQWVALNVSSHLCEHTSLTHLITSTKYTYGLFIGINVLPDFW